MSLQIELSLGSGKWMSLGTTTRDDWNRFNQNLPRCISQYVTEDTIALVVRLLEDGKPIDTIRRKLKSNEMKVKT